MKGSTQRASKRRGKATSAAAAALAVCAATATASSSSSSFAAVTSTAKCRLSTTSETTSASPLLVPRGGSAATDATSTATTESSAAVKEEVEREAAAAQSARRKTRSKKKGTKTGKPRSSSSTKERPSSEERSDGGASAAASEAAGDSSSSNGDKGSSGGGSGDRGLPPAAASILREKCFYGVLGISKAANKVDIQKAYRRRCVLTHPDKIPSGDRTAFDRVSEAYDVLGDVQKRAMYDRFGMKAFDGSGGGPGAGMNPGGFSPRGNANNPFFGNDVFREFFSGGGGNPFGQSSFQRPAAPPPPRNRDARYQLEVTLEELYAGTAKRVAVVLQRPRGSDPLQPHLRPRGGFPVRKEVEVAVSPGMVSGQAVRVHGAADADPGAPPGDAVFLLKQRPHPVFVRKGHDLAMEVTISLGEALVGFERTVRHLDGRTFVVVPPQAAAATTVGGEGADDSGDATAPAILCTGDVHVLKGEGMPKRGQSGERGDLYLQYVVETPGQPSKNKKSGAKKWSAANLTAEERKELARLLQKLEGVAAVVDRSAGGEDHRIDERCLSAASASDFGKASGTVEDDDEAGHDEHLRHDKDDGQSSQSFTGDLFRRAFAGGQGGGNGFQYFSSSSHGGMPGGAGFGTSPFFGGSHSPDDDDHKVECNQM